MVMEKTRHEMDTDAFGNFTSSLGKNDIPTGTVVLGKVMVCPAFDSSQYILTDAAGPERENQYIDTHVSTVKESEVGQPSIEGMSADEESSDHTFVVLPWV